MARSIQEFSRKQKRLASWDYSSSGYYFVTVCTRDQQYYFGNCLDGEVKLSKAGKIAENIWNKIPEQFSCVELDQYIIMPNHVHGIIIIDNSFSRSSNAINRVATGGITGKYNPMLTDHSLSKIIRWYKGKCTFEVNKVQPELMFKWQSRFHDRIIRNDKELYNIRKYIVDNPIKWELDSYNIL